MTHPDDSPPPHVLRTTLLPFLASEWPYLLMLGLALVGVAYTSFSQAPVRNYWLALCPISGLICIGAGVFIGYTLWGNASSLQRDLSATTEQVNTLKNERETLKSQLALSTRDKEACQKQLAAAGGGAAH